MGRRLVTVLAVLFIAGCARDSSPSTTAAGSTTTTTTLANPPSTPASRPPLFYERDGGIYVSEPAGAPGVPLVPRSGDACFGEPAPSPDGTYVAFVRSNCAIGSREEIQVIRRGRPETRSLVAGPARGPQWSPRGDQLAYVTASGTLAIGVVDLITGGRVEVSEDASGIAWSPDGSLIAWVAPGAPGRVGVADAETGASSVLVTATAPTSVAFDADGRSLLFTNAGPKGAVRAAVGGGGVYRLPLNRGPAAGVTPAPGSSDVASVRRGDAIGFTQPGTPSRLSLRILLADAVEPVTLSELPSAGRQGPRWWYDTAAYLTDAPLGRLMVHGLSDPAPLEVDRGVVSFAWPLRPPSRGGTTGTTASPL